MHYFTKNQTLDSRDYKLISAPLPSLSVVPTYKTGYRVVVISNRVACC